MMVNLSTIIKNRTESEDDIMIGLKGKTKGEANEQDHLFYCVKETSSGIKVQQWTDLLVNVKAKAGRNGGPAITNWKGTPLMTSDLDNKLHFFLEIL